MEIPAKIQVGGVEYTIHFVKNSDEKIPYGHVGNIYFREADILINEDTDPKVQEATFLHETLHAIFNAMCVTEKDVNIDEDFVDRLTHYLHQVILCVVEAQPVFVEYNSEQKELNGIDEETIPCIRGGCSINHGESQGPGSIDKQD